MIRIITDSSCDFDPEQAAKMHVDVLPIHIYFGETEYLDRQTLSVTDFYNKLETAEKLPTTSQITPYHFVQAFQPYVDAGDEIIGIFLSSKLSGTFQSATIAAQTFQTDRIFVIDSLNAALGHHLLVQIAVQLRDAGLPAREIADKLRELTKKVRLVACVQTMKYLVMGGRVSPALGKIGGILGINPLIEVTDGSVESVGKVRGYKAAHRWMLQYLEKHPASSRYPVVFTHSVNENGRDDMVQALDGAFLNKQYLYCDLGCTVGTHIGPGAIGFAYIEE